MSRAATASLGLVALVLLITGAPAFTEAANKALEDYELYPGVGYYMYFQTSDKNWTESLAICEDTYGGQMTVPNSEAETEVYKALLASADPEIFTVFVGFHDFFVLGEYETIQGVSVEKSGYPVWAANSPNTIPQLRCGAFAKEGGLRNINCAYSGNAITICELPLWADYDFIPGMGHYKLHTDAKTWNNAWRTCRDEGSHLAVINSEAEYAVLQELLARHPEIPNSDSSQYAHVGVHGKFGRNRFYTIFGTPLADSGYSTWSPGYPEFGVENSYNAGALGRDNGDLFLLPGDFDLAFFCEHEL